MGPEIVYVSGRTRAAGEMNGKSANLNNCASQIYPSDLPIPPNELICIFDADQARWLLILPASACSRLPAWSRTISGLSLRSQVPAHAVCTCQTFHLAAPRLLPRMAIPSHIHGGHTSPVLELRQPAPHLATPTQPVHWHADPCCCSHRWPTRTSSSRWCLCSMLEMMWAWF